MLEPSSPQQVPAVNNNAPSATSQTRAFSTIFLIEMWERFGFYGMQALIVYSGAAAEFSGRARRRWSGAPRRR